MTNWYQLTAEEIEKELKTDLHTGLEQKEAEARLISSGPNKIYEAKTESLLVIFLRQFGSPLILILLSTSLLLFAIKEIIGQPNLPVPEQKNMVFKSTHVVSGNVKAIVTATGFNTVVGKISETIKLIDTEIPLKASMRYLSHALILVISVVLTILFVSGIIAGRPAIEMFKVAVSLAV